MNKRFQVFISSTFADLREERQEVMQALLELRLIPAGMELFPAANESQWKLIQRVIDDSDYYIAIVAGRYGSLSPEGISYTEKEYRYALEKGKPILGFVHADPSKISVRYSEDLPERKEKLAAFRALVESKPVKYWDNAKDLGGKLSRSISILIQDEPATGWVRGDAALDESQVKEVLNLQMRVRELEADLTVAKLTAAKAVAQRVSNAKKRSDPKAKLQELAPESVSVLRMAVHPSIKSFSMADENSWYINGRSQRPEVMEPRGLREAALMRRAVKELTAAAFLDKDGGVYVASANAFEVGLKPLTPEKIGLLRKVKLLSFRHSLRVGL